MCGRFTLTADLDDVQRRFDFSEPDLAVSRRYNIAPTDAVVAVRRRASDAGARNHGEAMRWGLVPFWSKTGPKGPPMINARDDKIETSRMFSAAFERRRCLIPADGFYEWRKTGEGRKGAKVPLRFTLKGGGLFAFAGVWESWRAPDGERVRSCAIITTEPNELMAPIHDRMPVILPEEAEEAWLDPATGDFAALRAFLKPLPANSMECYTVSSAVNSVKNDDLSCIAAAQPPPQQSALL